MMDDEDEDFFDYDAIDQLVAQHQSKKTPAQPQLSQPAAQPGLPSAVPQQQQQQQIQPLNHYQAHQNQYQPQQPRLQNQSRVLPGYRGGYGGGTTGGPQHASMPNGRPATRQVAYQHNGGPKLGSGARAALSPARQPPQLQPHAGPRMGHVPLISSPSRRPLPRDAASVHSMEASPLASVVGNGGPVNAESPVAIPAPAEAAPGFQAPNGSDIAASAQRELYLMRNRLGETEGTVANLRSRNERLEREVTEARAAATRAPALAAGGGGGGLMAFAAQDLHRQLDAAQEQLDFKEQEMEELKRMAGERAERLREADRREAALHADAEKGREERSRLHDALEKARAQRHYSAEAAAAEPTSAADRPASSKKRRSADSAWGERPQSPTLAPAPPLPPPQQQQPTASGRGSGTTSLNPDSATGRQQPEELTPPFGRALLPAPLLMHYGGASMNWAPFRSTSGMWLDPSGPPLAAAAASVLRRPRTGALPAAELALRLWATESGRLGQLLSAAERPSAPSSQRSPWTGLPAAFQGADSSGIIHPCSIPLEDPVLSRATASLAAQLQLLAGGVGSGITALDAACCVLLAATAGPIDSAAVGCDVSKTLQSAARSKQTSQLPAPAQKLERAAWRAALSALRILRQLLLHDHTCKAAALDSCMVVEHVGASARMRDSGGAIGLAGSSAADSTKIRLKPPAVEGSTTAAAAERQKSSAPAALLSSRVGSFAGSRGLLALLLVVVEAAAAASCGAASTVAATSIAAADAAAVHAEAARSLTTLLALTPVLRRHHMVPAMTSGVLMALSRSGATQQRACCESLQLLLANSEALGILTASLQLPEGAGAVAGPQPEGVQKNSTAVATHRGPGSMAIDGVPGNRDASDDACPDIDMLPCEAWRGGWGLLSAVLALVAFPIQSGGGGGTAGSIEADLQAAVRELALNSGSSPGRSGGGNCRTAAGVLLRDYHGVRSGPFAVQRAALALTAALLEGRASAVLAPLLTGEVEEQASAAAAAAASALALDKPDGSGASSSLASRGVNSPAPVPVQEVSCMGLLQRLMAMLDSATRNPAGGILEGFQLPPSLPTGAQPVDRTPAHKNLHEGRSSLGASHRLWHERLRLSQELLVLMQRLLADAQFGGISLGDLLVNTAASRVALTALGRIMHWRQPDLGPLLGGSAQGLPMAPWASTAATADDGWAPELCSVQAVRHAARSLRQTVLRGAHHMLP